MKKKDAKSATIERLENAAKQYLEFQDEEVTPTEETQKFIHEAKKALEEAKKHWEKNKKSASEKIVEQPSVSDPPTSTKAAQPASAMKPAEKSPNGSDYLESQGDRAGKDVQSVSVGKPLEKSVVQKSPMESASLVFLGDGVGKEKT